MQILDLAVTCCIHDSPTSLFDRSSSNMDGSQEIAKAILHGNVEVFWVFALPKLPENWFPACFQTRAPAWFSSHLLHCTAPCVLKNKKAFCVTCIHLAHCISFCVNTRLINAKSTTASAAPTAITGRWSASLNYRLSRYYILVKSREKQPWQGKSHPKDYCHTWLLTFILKCW